MTAQDVQTAQKETPPSDLRAEAALLASLYYLRSTESVRSFLQPDHFYSEPNSLIYRTMLDAEMSGNPMDVITIVNQLRGQNVMERVGGSTYIADTLSSPAFDPANVSSYANIVVEKSRVRKAIRTMEAFIRKAYTVNGQTSEFFRTLVESVTDVAKQDIQDNWPTTKDILREMRAPLVRIPIGTGVGNVAQIDKALRGGMPAGRMMTIVGAPGSSKTTLAFQICMNLRNSGTALVCFCAYDEEPRDLMTRMGRHRGLDRAALERADSDALDQLDKIDDEYEWMLLDGMLDGALNLAVAIDSLIRRAKASNRIPVLGLDSIQRAYVPGCEDAESEKVRVTLVIGVLKAAKKQGVLVVATSEANRALYKDKGRFGDANLLAVAKESGAIEYQSDAMLVLQRCDSDEPQYEGMIVGVFPKNRVGLDDKEELWFTLDRDKSLLFDAEKPVKDEPPNKPGKADGRARMEKVTLEVISYVRGNPGASTVMILAAMKGKADREGAKAALGNAVYKGQIEARKKRGVKGDYYYVTDAPAASPTPEQDRPKAPSLRLVPPSGPAQDIPEDPGSDDDGEPTDLPPEATTNPDDDGDVN